MPADHDCDTSSVGSRSNSPVSTNVFQKYAYGVSVASHCRVCGSSPKADIVYVPRVLDVQVDLVDFSFDYSFCRLILLVVRRGLGVIDFGFYLFRARVGIRSGLYCSGG